MAEEKVETFEDVRKRNEAERPWLLGKTDVHPITGEKNSDGRARIEKIKADFEASEIERMQKYRKDPENVVPEDLEAALTGESSTTSPTPEDQVAELEKMTKAELVAKAEGLELDTVPDSMTKADIIAMIRTALDI